MADYLYDVTGGLPVLLEDGTRTYVWGLGLACVVDGSGTVEVYHADGLGSVRALTNASQTVVARYETDEFGVPTSTTGTSDQPFGFTGEQRDSQTGLVYLRARMYEPGVGRFLQRDPFAGTTLSPSSLNRYSYAGQNPVAFSDPPGLCRDPRPGSSGVRYCIDRWIPADHIGGSRGDHRTHPDDGSNDPNNTFRVRQLIFEHEDGTLGYSHQAGYSVQDYPIPGEGYGELTDCGATVSKSRALQTRTITVQCRAVHGVIRNAPPLTHQVVIQEGPLSTWAVAGGTPYPSLEVWQYSPAGARLLHFFDARGGHPFLRLWYEQLLSSSVP